MSTRGVIREHLPGLSDTKFFELVCEELDRRDSTQSGCCVESFFELLQDRYNVSILANDNNTEDVASEDTE